MLAAQTQVGKVLVGQCFGYHFHLCFTRSVKRVKNFTSYIRIQYTRVAKAKSNRRNTRIFGKKDADEHGKIKRVSIVFYGWVCRGLSRIPFRFSPSNGTNCWACSSSLRLKIGNEGRRWPGAAIGCSARLVIWPSMSKCIANKSKSPARVIIAESEPISWCRGKFQRFCNVNVAIIRYNKPYNGSQLPRVFVLK